MTVIKFICQEVDSSCIKWGRTRQANIQGRQLLRDILLRFEKMNGERALRYEFSDKKTADKLREYVVGAKAVKARLGKGIFKSLVLEENGKGVLYIAPGPKFECGPHNLRACESLFEELV